MLQAEHPTYSRVLECCNDAIAITPDNPKVLYRKGVALYHLKRADEAVDVLKSAGRLQTKPGMQTYLNLVALHQTLQGCPNDGCTAAN